MELYSVSPLFSTLVVQGEQALALVPAQGVRAQGQVRKITQLGLACCLRAVIDASLHWYWTVLHRACAMIALLCK